MLVRCGEWSIEAVQLRKGQGVAISNRKFGEPVTKEVGLQVPIHEQKRRRKSEHGELKMEKLQGRKHPHECLPRRMYRPSLRRC